MALARNDPCPCGSGRRYKRCCRRSARSEPAAVGPTPNLVLRDDDLGRRCLALSFPFAYALHAAVKRLPGRRFDWGAREWIVPCRPELAGMVAELLEQFPGLVASHDVHRWLAGAQRWHGFVAVEEVDGEPVFAVLTAGGLPPPALAGHVVPGRCLLLRGDRSHAELLVSHDGLDFDDLAERCARELAAGRRPPPATLELGQDPEGEPRFELHRLWGSAARGAFAALPEAAPGDRRPGRFHSPEDRDVHALPADAALAPDVDRFLAAHPAVAVSPTAAKQLEASRAEHHRRTEVVERSHARDAELELPELGGELRPFQRAGVAYTLAQRRAFIADEQGLGKTVQALAALEADGAFPAAVVCPAGLKLNWEREIRRWLPGRRVAVLQGRAEDGWRRAGAHDAEIVVLNYEVVEAHGERLAARGLRAAVFDESQYCKEPRAKRTKASIDLGRRVAPGGLRLALTGTPIVNHPRELISQLRLIDRLGDFGSGAGLSRRFRGPESLERLHWHLRAHCYVRRVKAEVLPQLPAKSHETVVLGLDNEAEYRLAEEDVIAWLRAQPLDLRTLAAKVAAALRAEQLVRLNHLRQIVARGKLGAALPWIHDFTATGEPLVVFAEHRDVQQAVIDRFPAALHVLGSDRPAARDAAVARFQELGGPPLIVCSLKAAAHGLTLTRASNVAFLELDWTPARHDQAEDRCHRIGQHDAVTAWYLLAPETIDESMARMLARKRGIIGAVTDGRPLDDERLVEAVVRELRGRPYRHLQAVA